MASCIILPVFLASFLIGNKQNLSDEEFISSFAFLLRDFKESIFCLYFHVFFFVRGLIIVVSVHLLYDFPLTQVIICSVACWIVIYIGIHSYVND